MGENSRRTKRHRIAFLLFCESLNGIVFPEGHTRSDIREVIPENYNAILSLNIHTKEKLPVGELAKVTFVDHFEWAIEICQVAGVPFSLTDFGISVWGYTTPSSNVKFYGQ
ncbi:MAG: hypothetical protein COA79_17510 [Planctomycetota bacterium]|nr:MAG: hypothetical protein COA79_17510 [Planctomycetota bacterium]